MNDPPLSQGQPGYTIPRSSHSVAVIPTLLLVSRVLGILCPMGQRFPSTFDTGNECVAASVGSLKWLLRGLWQ